MRKQPLIVVFAGVVAVGCCCWHGDVYNLKSIISIGSIIHTVQDCIIK